MPKKLNITDEERKLRRKAQKSQHDKTYRAKHPKTREQNDIAADYMRLLNLAFPGQRANQQKEWHKKNPTKRSEYFQVAYAKDPEKFKSRALADYWEDPEAGRAKCRANYAKDPAKHVARASEWAKNNPERHRENRRNSYHKRYSADLGFRILCSLRGRLTKVTRLAAAKKFTHTFNLLGCDLPNFMIYLESKFEPGMTWDAFREGKIHIDHVVPCDLFDLAIPVHQAYCFHFSNLAPLWKLDNLKKNKYVPANFNLSEHLSKPLSPTPALGTEPQPLVGGIDKQPCVPPSGLNHLTLCH